MHSSRAGSQYLNGLYRATTATLKDLAQALTVVGQFAALKVLMGQLSGAQSAEQRGRIEKLFA